MSGRSNFSDRFRALVVPRLQASIDALAPDVASGSITFSEAQSDVMAEATRLGASNLPPAHLDDLIDLIQTDLLDAVILAEEADALVQSLLREPSRDVLRAAVRGFLD